MFAIMIRDSIGNQREWMRVKSAADVRENVSKLPANGWELACVLVWDAHHFFWKYSSVLS